MSYFTAQIKTNSGLNSDVVKCRAFEDIPFERWARAYPKGQLVLQYPSLGYESNFALSNGNIRHVGAPGFHGKEFSIDALRDLYLELPGRARKLAVLRGLSKEDANDVVDELRDVSEEVLDKHLSVKSESGSWGTPLAMLAGVGMLAVAKAAKTNKVAVEKVKEKEVVQEVV